MDGRKALSLLLCAGQHGMGDLGAKHANLRKVDEVVQGSLSQLFFGSLSTLQFWSLGTLIFTGVGSPTKVI